MNLSRIDKKDYRYIKDNPNFSEKYNKHIIDETIRETEQYFKTLNSKLDEGAKERLNILSSYAIYRFNKGTKKFKDYVGRKVASQLIGEKILHKIRLAEEKDKILL